MQARNCRNVWTKHLGHDDKLHFAILYQQSDNAIMLVQLDQIFFTLLSNTM